MTNYFIYDLPNDLIRVQRLILSLPKSNEYYQDKRKIEILLENCNAFYFNPKYSEWMGYFKCCPDWYRKTEFPELVKISFYEAENLIKNEVKEKISLLDFI